MSDKISTDSAETSQLLSQVQQGDSLAIPRLLKRYEAYIVRLVNIRLDELLRRRVDPSDVVQETHLTVLKRLGDYLERRPASFKIWLRSEVLQQIVRVRRRHLEAEKRTVFKEVVLSDASSLMIAKSLLSASPSAIARRREESERVRAAIDLLDKVDREIILLRRVDELSNEETAEVLGLKPDTARKRYGRAIRRLAVLLSRDETT